MENKKVKRILDWYMGIIALMALASLIAKYGFFTSQVIKNYLFYGDYFIIASFIANSLIRLIFASRKAEYISSHKVQYILAFLFIFQLITFKLFFITPEFKTILGALRLVSITKIYIIIFQGYILFELLMQLGRLHQSITKFPLPPSLLLVGSFVAIIIAGTLLLLLPRATVSGKISFVDALFTATSATCVTGLIVVDTGTYFAKFGQTVILLLIQLGGLGLMTFATFFALIIRGELGLRERMLLGDILNIRAFSKIKSLIKSIIVATVLIEMTGAILIYLVFKGTPPAGEGGLYSSIFHSVSAFCNAGFSLFSTSFIEYQSHLGMNLIITGLIILGGFGFVVIADIWRYITSPFKDKFRRLPHFSLQTRVVFSTSLILIALGTVIIFTIDYNHHLANLPLGTKLLASYFQSVTSRTAGFNTLDIARVHIGTLWILVILMFIGASPGSTGGGIKTTSFATLFALIKSKIKGIGEVNLFNRRIPLDVIHGAIMVTVLGFSVFFTGALILSITESAAFEHILFEVMSAFGTVGLSCGITSSLSTIGKLVITVIMLVGRIGPLTLIFAIPSKRSEGKFRYTEERVMIG